MPGVRVYPNKEVESGAQVHESLIWESRASSRLFGKDGVSGLVNVDLTPEIGHAPRGRVRNGAPARRHASSRAGRRRRPAG